KALRNIPPVLQMVWQSGPKLVLSNLRRSRRDRHILRVLAAVVPGGILSLPRLIVGTGLGLVSGKEPLRANLWWLVALEFLLAALNSSLSRLIDYTGCLFADRFTLHISTRVMEHAASLDLASYEDPKFHDKLERARAQSTEGLAMIQAIGCSC